MDYFTFSVNSFLRDLRYLNSCARHLNRTIELFHAVEPGSYLYYSLSRNIKHDSTHMFHYARLTLESLEK